MKIWEEFRLVLSVVTFGSLVTFSCCDDPEPNQCKDAIQMQGGFSIKEHLQAGGFDNLIVSDTVITENPIVFSADTTYASYSWKIGDDPRTFNTKDVTLTFDFPEDNIPITLIVTWKKNTKCFPNDDGVDTVVHLLTVIPREENPIFGTYTGVESSTPNDVFDVVITPASEFQRVVISNLNKGCDPVDASVGAVGFISDMGYKKLAFTGFYLNNCKNPEGLAFFHSNNKDVTINYTIGNGTEENNYNETTRIPQKFVGTKKN